MKKVAFVLGGANTLVEDLKDAEAMARPDTYIATNETGRDFDGYLPHWVTLHTEKITDWYAYRVAAGLGPVGDFWTSNTKTLPNNEYLTPKCFKNVPTWDGSSGLLAVTVALHLGYEKIILCGVPLDKKAAHYFDDDPWMDAPRYRHAWLKYQKQMEGKVKSMSGWTQIILGAPTLEWLNDN